MINVFQPSLGEQELEAVRQVFAANWVGKGPKTREFEAAFAQHRGVSAGRMVSVSCCTEGLFQAINLLGIGAGDEVILPSLSFVGAANAVAASGARPVFCDVDRRTLNATAAHIETCITAKTRAVIVMHYGGVPCEMDDINALAQANGLALIEDSACGVASTYRGQPCGTMGDIGLWSFDAMKILVTGDGGMVYCRDEAQTVRLRRMLYLGLAQRSGFSQTERDRWWEFEISEFGRRAIMNDIAAAIGLEQIKQLPDFIALRKQVHETYDAALAHAPAVQTPPLLPPHVTSSHYFYWIQIPRSHRDALAAYLLERGIYTTFRYHPLHQVARYGSDADLPNADWAAEHTLCLPIHQALTEQDVAQVCDGVIDYMRDAGL